MLAEILGYEKMSESVRLSPASEPSNAACKESAPERRRRSIRLRGFDYAQAGAYFVTICTRRSACVLGEVVAGEVRLSEAGRVVQTVWEGLPRHYPHVQLDAWIIMPNHVHGIVILTADPVGAGLKPAQCVYHIPLTTRRIDLMSPPNPHTVARRQSATAKDLVPDPAIRA